jgi:hypothetical protein
MQTIRLQALLDRYVDGLLDAEEKAELEMMLLRSAEARTAFWEHADWHAALREYGEQSWGRKLAEASAAATPCSPPPTPRRRQLAFSRPLTTLAWPLSAALAALLLAVWLAGRFPRETHDATSADIEQTTDGVAILTQTAGTEWEESGTTAKIGAILTPGDLRLRAGLAQIEFLSGGMVILEGPARLTLISSRQAYLAYGKVRVHVPPEAHGFEIRSSATDVVDLGTEFGMQVGEGRRAEVHVFDGKVELHDPGAAATAPPRLALTAGRGVRLDAAGKSEEIAADGAGYPNAAEVSRRLDAQAARHLRDWETHCDAVRRDPRVLRYYTFDGQSPWDRVVRSEAATASGAGQAAIVGCQWTEGRWPRKGALDFRRIGDRVRLSVDGAYESLTLAASIRIDALENRYNSIFMCDDFEPGGIHWQITREGNLALGAQSADRLHGLTYRTPAIFGPEKLGQWVHVAAVIDGAAGLVTQYVDGRSVNQESIPHKVTLHLDAAELGNWSHAVPPKSQPIRSFSGRIEEFILFNAVLTPQEILRLARVDQPAM